MVFTLRDVDVSIRSLGRVVFSFAFLVYNLM